MHKPMKLACLLAATVTTASALAACGGTSGGGGSTDDTLSVGLQSPLLTFDPTKMDCATSRLYCQAAYDTLVHLSADGEPEPGMAESFEYDAKGTALTLTLRKGITFTDGTAFDATTAKAALDWFIKNGGPNAAMSASITQVLADGDNLVIALSEPDPALLGNLASNLGMMASPEALKSSSIGTEPAGSGPYVYNKARSQTGSTYFDRNDDYWDTAAYPFAHLELVQLSDPNTVLNALKVGQIDAATVGARELPAAKEAGLSVMESAGSWTGLVLADRDGKVQPALGEVEVRQAINLALDRDFYITELVPTGAVATDQIFAPGGPAYDEALDAQFDHDVDKAKALMSEAGYADGFSVTMPDLSQFVGGPAPNAALEQMLGAINIKVTWEKVPVIELLGAMQGGKFAMFMMALPTQSPWQDIQAAVLPEAAFNAFHNADPALDRLLSAARNATPGAEQDAAYKAINTWLVDNAWFAPLINSSTPFVSVEGVTIEPQVQGVDLARYQPTKK